MVNLNLFTTYRMKLYAIPYAGGHSLVYRNLSTALSPQIILQPLELPGRGKRAKEDLKHDIHDITEDLFQLIREDLTNNTRYAIFGHSMGSLLGYLLTVRIMEEGLPMPSHLFCSGHSAPSVPKIDLVKDAPKYAASSEEFWAYIDSLGALPPELKEHQELMNYFEPIIRADIQALEKYEYQELKQALNVSIDVFYGIDDTETPVYGLFPWQNETKHMVQFIPNEGGHFGLFTSLERVSIHIKQTLLASEEQRK